MTEHPIFDTHAHYHDTKFLEGEEPGSVFRLLDTLFSTEISHIVDIGTDIPTSEAALAMAERYPGMYAAVGMYPGSCPQPFSPAEAETAIERFRELLRHPKAIAIGEIGFDFHYDDVPRDIQAFWFERQLQLAAETGYPVLIHDREAHGAVLDMLKRYPTVTGVLHSYSGSAETAAELIRMGYYISVSGVVTFKNARQIKEVVSMLPDDRILIETDCPYLTPVPHRGERNHSGYLTHTAQMIADIRKTTEDYIRDMTRQNALRVFRLEK